MLEREFKTAGRYIGSLGPPVGSVSAIVDRMWFSVRASGGADIKVSFKKSADADGFAPDVSDPWVGTIKSARRANGECPDTTEWLDYDITVRGPGYILLEMLAKK